MTNVIKVGYKDVVKFFETADIDLASLTHDLVGASLQARKAKKDEVSKRMTKARASRKTTPVAAAPNAAPNAAPAEVAKKASA